MLLGIEANVGSFRDLLPQTVKRPKQRREKCGIANLVGYTMKYLFGAMDNRDMETINHFIDSVSIFAEKVARTAEQQATYIKQLDSREHDNTKNIVAKTTMLRKEMVDNLSEIAIRGQRWLAFSAAMRDLEVALIQKKEDLLQLQ
jgi:hypothetical protein